MIHRIETTPAMQDPSDSQADSSSLHNDRYQTVVALISFIIAGLGLSLAAVLWFWSPISKEHYSIIFSIISAVLFFDLPVCIVVAIEWLQTGIPPELTLPRLFPCREEREFLRNLRQRPPRNDDEFYDTFYADSHIPKALVIRLRSSLEAAYGRDLSALIPTDNLFYADSEIDLSDVLFRLSHEFDIVIPGHRQKALDGTFDSLLRCIAESSSEANKSGKQ